MNKEDDNEWTPLRMAISEKNLEIIQLLSTNGANLNLIDTVGWTPLTYAIEDPDNIEELEKENIEIVKLLVENGANMNIYDGSGATAFQEAIMQKRKKILKFCLDNGANLTMRTLYKRNNALELAMKDNHVDILKQLIIHNMEISRFSCHSDFS